VTHPASPGVAAAASSAGTPAHPLSPTAREILEATQELLLEEGVEGVSIRKLSERCGYTAPTIYHHFGDKRGLLDTLLEERFRLLLAAMTAIPSTGDPVRHLRDMAQAFVAFALENPSHYQLLMEPGLGSPESVPSAEAARALVRGDLEALAQSGSLATGDLDAAFQVLWAVLHGVISLRLGVAGEPIAVQAESLAYDVVETGLLRAGLPQAGREVR
jgi:AcrR family transcriptional regulator